MKLTKEGRASLESRYANAFLARLQHDRGLQEDVAINGWLGAVKMSDDELISHASDFGIAPAQTEIDPNPFTERLQSFGGGFLVGERKINNMDEISEEELAFICKAVNAYSALVRVLEIVEADRNPTVATVAARKATQA